MSYFNIVAETNENTVVTEYIPEPLTTIRVKRNWKRSLSAVWGNWAMSI